jgi:hypothetical protein
VELAEPHPLADLVGEGDPVLGGGKGRRIVAVSQFGVGEHPAVGRPEHERAAAGEVVDEPARQLHADRSPRTAAPHAAGTPISASTSGERRVAAASRRSWSPATAAAASPAK